MTAMPEYLEALLQGTSGGKPGLISPRRKEPPPFYNVARMMTMPPVTAMATSADDGG